MSVTPGAMHVACSCDQNYIADAAVMLRSLFVENPDERFVVHFMYDQRLPSVELEGMGALCEEFGQTLSPLLMGEELKQVFPFMGRYGGFNAWYRILLPRLLADLPKVLYLDVDLLITGRVRPLWEIELGDNCIAAVTNPLFDHMVERVRMDLGLPDGKAYFNSGVMLMDLDALRRIGASDQVVEFIRDNRAPMPWADQEPLNAVLHAHRLHLPPRWNAMPAIWELPQRYLPWDSAAVDEAQQRPAIVHFLGAYKPWHYLNKSPYRRRYFEHLAQTRWKDRPLVGASMRNRLLRPLPALWQWRIEAGELAPRKLARRLLPMDSAAGGLVRDALRALTPRRPRAPLSLILDALAAGGGGSLSFIQIGSNDANHNDPLRPYILRHGWRGVMVEPVPHVFERLRRNYASQPGLNLENVAIGESDGEATFYCLAKTDDPLPAWHDQIGSFSLDTVLKHENLVPGEPIPDIRSRVVELHVPCLRFESLCHRHGIRAVDLIHVDTEGYDHRVVAQIDLASLRPTMLLYEHKHLDAGDRTACRDRVEKAGYDCLELDADTVCLRREAVAHPLSRLGRAWRLARRAAQARRARIALTATVQEATP